ncbi:MAG: hypothetical protein HZA00_06265 [Nitrospinae bacterium]|nr:hypothetical protein [Nitrospinota bacterium]
MKRIFFIAIALMLVFGLTASANAVSYNFTSLDYPGSVYTEAYGISGVDIVGFYRDADGISHGFFYDGITWTAINYPGATGTYATGISGGNIVGWYYHNPTYK